MGYAFMHVVFGWIIGKLYEKFRSVQFTYKEWILVVFFSLLPDSDFLIDWVFGTNIHRTFTHSLLFLVLAVGISYLVVKHYKKITDNLPAIVCLGIASHIILDVIFAPGVMLFFPLNNWISITAIEFTNVFIGASFDMAVGVAFLFYQMYKNKIIL